MRYPDPLAGYEDEPPLPDSVNPDGKSLFNPHTDTTSPAYDQFPSPINPNKNGFDFHIYYIPTAPDEFEYARKLHQRIRREFPEVQRLRIYKFWEKPVGPHPTAMFEVNTFTPHQTGAFFSWLAVYRGPCSVLIHPNTDDSVRDHTELATWMGKQWPINIEALQH